MCFSFGFLGFKFLSSDFMCNSIKFMREEYYLSEEEVICVENIAQRCHHTIIFVDEGSDSKRAS